MHACTRLKHAEALFPSIYAASSMALFRRCRCLWLDLHFDPHDSFTSVTRLICFALDRRLERLSSFEASDCEGP